MIIMLTHHSINTLSCMTLHKIFRISNFFAFSSYEVPHNNRFPVVVFARHVMKRPSKRTR